MTEPTTHPADGESLQSQALDWLLALEDADAATLARFRYQVTTRRILVRPFFADAEYNRRSMRVVDHITRAQVEWRPRGVA